MQIHTEKPHEKPHDYHGIQISHPPKTIRTKGLIVLLIPIKITSLRKRINLPTPFREDVPGFHTGDILINNVTTMGYTSATTVKQCTKGLILLFPNQSYTTTEGYKFTTPLKQNLRHEPFTHFVVVRRRKKKRLVRENIGSGQTSGSVSIQIYIYIYT